MTRSTRAGWPSCCGLIISNPVYHGEHGLRRSEGTGAQLSHHHQRCRTGHVAGEGDLSQLGHSLHRQAGLCSAPSCRVAREDRRSRECAGGRSFTTNNSMRCGWCVSKCGGICSRRARNTRPGNCSARFLRSARSGPPCCLASCRLRIVSAPSGSYGPTADLASRHKAAPITVVSTGSCNERRNRFLFRGLNRNHNHDLKNLFKGAAIVASNKPGPFPGVLHNITGQGIRPEMARLTLARKIATIVLIVWKRGACFDAQHLKPQTA